jgi:hypothetical protein
VKIARFCAALIIFTTALVAPGNTESVSASWASEMSLTVTKPTWDSGARAWRISVSWQCVALVPADGCAIESGKEIVAIAFSKPVTLKFSSPVQWNGSNGNGDCPRRTWNNGVLYAASQTGVAMTWSSKRLGCWRGGRLVLDYTSARGNVTMYVTGPVCDGKKFQVFATYGHSWSNTSVSGVGLQPWGASISWSSSKDHWEKVAYSTAC